MASTIPIIEGSQAQHILTLDGAGNKYYFEFEWSHQKFPVQRVKVIPYGSSINHVKLLNTILCQAPPDEKDPLVENHLVLFCQIVGANGDTSATFNVNIDRTDYCKNCGTGNKEKQIRCVVITYGTKEKVPTVPLDCKEYYKIRRENLTGTSLIPDVDKDGNIIIDP